MKKLYTFIFIGLASSHVFGQFTNVQIDPSNTYGETSILVNPKNTNNLVAGCNIDNIYYSNNGGVTWTTYNLPSSFGNQGDPCAAVDSNGNWYFSHLTPSLDRVVIHKSLDGGQTWPSETFTGLTIKDVDKEWIAVDWSPNSPYENHLYCTWAELDAYSSSLPSDSAIIKISKSTDAGQTWSTPVRVSTQAGNCGFNAIKGAVPAFGPNGEVYVVWCGNGVSFQKSTDGGQTWLMNDIIVDNQIPTWYFTVPGFTYGTGFPGIATDVSGGPNNGNIYITWCDQRNGTGNTDVFLARSTNGGVTWNTVRVNNDVTITHQSHPWVCVDQVTGNVYLSFYDRRNTSGNNTDVYVAVSTDGGNSFSNIRVNTTTFLPNGVWCDYNNITAHNNKIWPIWTGASASVWTAICTYPAIVGQDELSDSKPTLFQNYPNPFNSYTFFDFSLPRAGKATLKIFDVLGKEILTVFRDEEFDNGMQHIEVSSQKLGLAPGIYYCTLYTALGEDTRKINVVD